MNASAPDPLSQLTIPPEKKRPRKGGALLSATLISFTLLVLLLYFLMTRAKNKLTTPYDHQTRTLPTNNAAGSALPSTNGLAAPEPGGIVLTVSGYIIPRERIELSTKFPGTVQHIAVQKGDWVKKGDLIVQLEDAEYRALLQETQGRLALAQANRAHAEAQYRRQVNLNDSNSGTPQDLDDARRGLEAAQGEVLTAQGQVALAQTRLDWCTITAPIDGTVLEKIVDEQEQVIPQGLGLSRGPSTTLVALADLTDLQVEVDINESDTAKVHLKQPCRITPEAYPDKIYDGFVAEIAPEADRQKLTLQVKVQIKDPDQFLTPELTAKVHFLREDNRDE